MKKILEPSNKKKNLSWGGLTASQGSFCRHGDRGRSYGAGMSVVVTDVTIPS
jgi:hypothetical protein